MANVQMAPETGAVTFLDVLGWKGIWQKSENNRAMDALYTLIQETKNKARDISLSFISEEGDRGKVTMVLSISDTIALFTSGEASTAIQTQAEICSWLIPHALEMELPLRGAISYGTYSVKENIMLGYAVDEAASWHETTDWIGVVLAPSAQMRYSGTISAPFAKYAAIPFKRPEKNLMICVDWTYPNKESLYRIIEPEIRVMATQ